MSVQVVVDCALGLARGADLAGKLFVSDVAGILLGENIPPSEAADVHRHKPAALDTLKCRKHIITET